MKDPQVGEEGPGLGTIAPDCQPLLLGLAPLRVQLSFHPQGSLLRTDLNAPLNWVSASRILQDAHGVLGVIKER